MNSLCGTSAAFRRILSSVFPKLTPIRLCLATFSSVMLPLASPRESNMEKIIHINKAANTYLNLIFSEIILFFKPMNSLLGNSWTISAFMILPGPLAILTVWFQKLYNASLSGNPPSMPQLNKNYQFLQKYIMNVYVYSTNITDQTC